MLLDGPFHARWVASCAPWGWEGEVAAAAVSRYSIFSRAGRCSLTGVAGHVLSIYPFCCHVARVTGIVDTGRLAQRRLGSGLALQAEAGASPNSVSSGPRGAGGAAALCQPPGWAQRAAPCGAVPWRGPRSPCPRAWPCTPLSCRMADAPQCLCIREKTKTRSTKPPRCVRGDCLILLTMKNVKLIKAQQVGHEDGHRHSGPGTARRPAAQAA